MSPLGYLVASTLLGIIGGGGIAGVAMHWWRTRIDLNARAEVGNIDAKNVPLQLLKDQLTKRETELSALRAEHKEDRGRFLDALNAFKGILTASEATLKQIAGALEALREEERGGRAKLHERIDIVDKELLVIKTRLED